LIQLLVKINVAKAKIMKESTRPKSKRMFLQKTQINLLGLISITVMRASRSAQAATTLL